MAEIMLVGAALMSRFIRWLLRSCIHFLRAVYRPLPPLVNQAFRTSWYYLRHSMLPAVYRPLQRLLNQALRTSRDYIGRLLLPAFERFRTVKPYIGPLITIVYKIIQFVISLIKRWLPVPTIDDNELVVIASAKPRGLQNLGNTCYFNSAMQPLCHTYILKELLRQNQTAGELTKLLRDFYTKMLSGDTGSFSPHDLHQIFSRESSRFDNRRQHDSHECLRHFLDNIRKEERRHLDNADSGSNRNNLTVVDTVFGGHLITVYICMTCQDLYHVFEPCLDISLPICFETRKGEGLNKTVKDVPMNQQDEGKEMNEDETSELKQTCEDKIMRTKEGEDEEEGGEEEEEDEKEEEEEEEGDEEEDDKENKDAKRKQDRTENKVIELEDNEAGCDEGIGEENERKRRVKDENIEKEAREKGTEEEKEQNEECSSKKEEDEKAVRDQNEAKLKKEHIEEKEKDEARKHNIVDMASDEEEKHVTEEKRENEKLHGDEYISHKDENKGKRSENRGKEIETSSAMKEQSSSTLENNYWKLKQQPDECKGRLKKKVSRKLSVRKEKANTEPVSASVRSHEFSDVDWTTGGTMVASLDEEICKENEAYKNIISSLMRPLSSCSSTQLSSIHRKPYSIEDCLKHFTREELIDKEYLCNDCCRKHYENGGEDMLLTSATKQTLIFNPPAILTLHMKRFELKPGGSVKRTDMITYGELLDIAPYCSSQCLRNDPPYRNIWYSLYAVVVHSGSLEFGHYKAYVKVQRNDLLGVNRFLQREYFDRDVTKEDLIQMMVNKKSRGSSSATDAVWYCANDSSVSETSLNTVLNQEAYLLFYERM